jgi:hypothetical protein
VKIASYLRVGSNTTINIVLSLPRSGSIFGWREGYAGECSEIGLGGSGMRRLCTSSQARKRK